jgi:hypothetical protein
MAPGPHTAVKQELLVRYLDFWTPAALGAVRRATYLDRSPHGAVAAVRVFTEFADLLAGRALDMLVAGPLPPEPGVDGLRVRAAPADLTGAVRQGPLLAHVEGAVEERLLAAVGAVRGGEVLLVSDPVAGDPRPPLYAAGFGFAAAVELVDEAGRAQLLRFATSAARSLERFKDELWAVDQFAGVRYRDPAEPDAVPLDISIEPHPGPLRRALLAHLATGGSRTVGELREYALTRTLYRPADVARALHPLLARGALTREPQRGRLTGATRVRLAG